MVVTKGEHGVRNIVLFFVHGGRKQVDSDDNVDLRSRNLIEERTGPW